MKRFITLFMVILGSHLGVAAQGNAALLEQIKQHPSFEWGGCDVVECDGVAYLVGVSSVEVGTKKVPALRTVGTAKARRDVIAFLNGSNITSSAEMNTSETVTDVDGRRTIVLKEEWVESIREDVGGWVQGFGSLGAWYSDDRELFFVAIYCAIE